MLTDPIMCPLENSFLVLTSKIMAPARTSLLKSILVEKPKSSFIKSNIIKGLSTIS